MVATPSQRTAIRLEIARRIRGTGPNWATAAANRVFISRAAAISLRDMPAALVYTEAETVDPEQPHPSPTGPELRTLSVGVEIVAAGENSDASAESLCDEVETAIYGTDDNLGGLVRSVDLDRIDFEAAGEGAKVFVVAKMTFSVRYYVTPAEDPDAGIDGRDVTLFGSWAPDIGPPNIDDYVELSEVPPEIS